jgi:hypothetical protein
MMQTCGGGSFFTAAGPWGFWTFAKSSSSSHLQQNKFKIPLNDQPFRYTRVSACFRMAGLVQKKWKGPVSVKNEYMNSGIGGFFIVFPRKHSTASLISLQGSGAHFDPLPVGFGRTDDILKPME